MQSRKHRLLTCEELESRRVLATISVTTLQDFVDIPENPSLAELPGPDGTLRMLNQPLLTRMPPTFHTNLQPKI
jgi:hypothetical protein